MSNYITLTLLLLTRIAFFGVFSYVIEVTLKDLSNGHTVVGDEINLECTVKSHKPQVIIQWKSPVNINLTSDRISATNETLKLNFLYITKSFYKIHNSTRDDGANYYCTVIDTENPSVVKYKYIWVPVYGKNESVIEFYKERTFFDAANMTLQIFVRAHPETRFQWFDKNNKTISRQSVTKFLTETQVSNEFANYKTCLTFNQFFSEDLGNYTIIAQNMYEEKSFIVLVNVTGVPATSLKIKNVDEESNIIECQAISSPKPNITWSFENCSNLSCFQIINENKKKVSTRNQFSKDNGLQVVSFTTLTRPQLGILRCTAQNIYGQESSVQYIYKVKNEFEIFSSNMISKNITTIEALFNEDVEITCAVSLDVYHPDIKWFHKGRNLSLDDVRVPVKNFDEYHIKKINAIYSSVSTLMVNIGKGDSGDYFCKAYTKEGKLISKVIRVNVREQPTLNVASNLQNKTILVKYGKIWKFYCNADGYPTPRIQWYKNNTIIENSKKTKISDNNQTLSIFDVDSKDNGTYKCKIVNRLNQQKIRIAKLVAIENDFDWLLVIIIILVLALIVVTIIIVIKVYKENKLRKELELAGLTNFEEGAVEHLNPDLRLDDQAELLPYDKKWEIPAEKLILGKELGSGAFGMVVKGELSGFPDEKCKYTVAVKMVNKLAGHDCIKALVSELKVMAHLGKHVNIVNLIGACTKDIMKKKLLVVVEYCEHGNLLDFILFNSNNFVDQRKNKDEFDWALQMSETNLQYTTLSFTSINSSDSGCNSEQCNNQNCCFEKKRSSLCSKDLLIWSFQITKGMEYLASRNVLHGDLAARNILLGENNVIKIADFGLARNMYKNGLYKKTAKSPLPVKWMALESIGENIFSTQSDVWSFGVVLWELFSLAKTPYPGIQVDQNFYKKLFGGYRMEIPEYATEKMYEIMLECWQANPTKRPTFTKLVEKIGVMLEEPIKKHYLDMNCPYVTMSNPDRLQNSKDYLLMMGAPDFENIVKSCAQFVNNINYFHTYQNMYNLGYASDKTDNNDCHDV